MSIKELCDDSDGLLVEWICNIDDVRFDIVFFLLLTVGVLQYNKDYMENIDRESAAYIKK